MLAEVPPAPIILESDDGTKQTIEGTNVIIATAGISTSKERTFVC